MLLALALGAEKQMIVLEIKWVIKKNLISLPPSHTLPKSEFGTPLPIFFLAICVSQVNYHYMLLESIQILTDITHTHTHTHIYIYIYIYIRGL